jgi:hypothetical protein
MKKSLILIGLSVLTTSLLAYSDADLDGVEDSVDKCPGTSLSELVDITGCPKKSLISQSKFDMIVGVSYSDTSYESITDTDTISTSLQVDYYYKDYSFQVSTSYYETSGDGYDDSGMNDTFVGMAYNIRPINSLVLRVGAGVSLPTYDAALDNNNADYTGSLGLSYSLGVVNLFGGYSYTVVGDDDVSATDSNGTTINYVYQDTSAYNAGMGVYIGSKLYVSASYNNTESIYKGVDNVETATLYTYYTIDQNWFSMVSYSYGISDTATQNFASIRLGYLF